MRIVYTNLKENDAGVKRSVRQLRVEFNTRDGRSVSQQPSVEACRPATDQRNEEYGVPGPETPETTVPSCIQQNAPVAEGMGAFRNMFIKRFTDSQVAAPAGNKGNFCITV
ncbi:MAG: hypothetical protein ABSC19_14150 [Syntrophorhabdales bacterium]|jgi:hypothetical protein